MRLRTSTEGRVTRLFADGVEIGMFGKTEQVRPDMRWKWSGAGTFGYCATKVEAFTAVKELAVQVLLWRRQEAERQRFYDRLPTSLQILWIGLQGAQQRLRCAEARDWFDPHAVEVARAEAVDALQAYDAAEQAWLSRMERAA